MYIGIGTLLVIIIILLLIFVLLSRGTMASPTVTAGGAAVADRPVCASDSRPRTAASW